VEEHKKKEKEGGRMNYQLVAAWLLMYLLVGVSLVLFWFLCFDAELGNQPVSSFGKCGIALILLLAALWPFALFSAVLPRPRYFCGIETEVVREERES
jgi:hypothetical protein